MAAAAAVELLAGARHSRVQILGRCLLAGGAALAYANFVPRSHWGVRSGIAFAHLPAVSAMRNRLAPPAPFEHAALGALIGWLLRQAA
ncbi:MAG TPA: hypothetical protein VGS58_08140 [Candidatus Sulfopaludibacter sp.]|nr:hypothetical protein [Candidatus Sulfopaludibacter sp.]